MLINSVEEFPKMDKQITMKIPEEMYQDLKEISAKKGNKPIGNLIRRSINDYIRKNKLKGIHNIISYFLFSTRSI